MKKQFKKKKLETYFQKQVKTEYFQQHIFNNTEYLLKRESFLENVKDMFFMLPYFRPYDNKK